MVINNPWIKLLICFFLGVFGVHKFLIEKKSKMGFLYLLTIGLFGIGWLFDVVKYLVPALKTLSINQIIKTESSKQTITWKKKVLWGLTVFFGLAALVYLTTGSVTAGLLGALFVALIIPIDSWQRKIDTFVKGKLKPIIAVALAIFCIATVPSPENPVVEPSESTTLSTDYQTDHSTDSTTESTLDNNVAATTIPTTPTIDPTDPPTESSAPSIPAVSSFNIHFIDVGQADAALVECDGHYMLIDGGNKADSNRIYAVLKNANVSKLDIVVGSHAHEDHIGGIPGAFNYTTADITLCPVKEYDSDAFEDFARYAALNGGGITVPVVGDTYSLGSATVTILGVNGGTDTNNTSIILRIDYGDTSFLFTGDAEREAEQTVLNSGADLSVTVLKVGHHGSDTSTTYPFLREIMPQYAIISVGSGNSYGHPTEDTLSRLRDADVALFRTDLQGDIYCTSDGKTVTFTVSKNSDVDVFRTIGKNSTETEPVETKPPETVPPATEAPTEAPTEDNGRDYVVNKNTGKFHYPWCSSADRIKKSNRWDYHGNREKLISMGYVPCKNCDP